MLATDTTCPRDVVNEQRIIDCQDSELNNYRHSLKVLLGKLVGLLKWSVCVAL